MGNDSYPVLCTASGTTTIGSCILFGVSVNKTTTGTITVQESSSSVGAFAASTPVGMYYSTATGTRFANLEVVLSTTDNVTIFVKHV
jgi:hypothetical protein